MKIGVLGYRGRMGKALQSVAAEASVELVELLPDTQIGALDALIDFSSPSGLLELAQRISDSSLPLVSGTTGLSQEEHTKLAGLVKNRPFLHAANFSVGVNVLEHLVELGAKATRGFDIEVFEAHHKHKVDAPGGTAIFLAEAAARARELDLQSVAEWGRHGQVGPRSEDEIGFQVVRGGSIVGEHTVFFAGEGERLELTHRAQDRTIFARGALRAAKWLVDKPTGNYSMRDVLFS